MRKIALLLLIVLAVWAAFNRERIFVRDPMASVYRNDVKQTGIEAYLNFSNDILLQQSGGPTASRTIVQHWDRVPGIPQSLLCLRWIACLTPADHAPVLPTPAEGKRGATPLAEMNGRHITYVDLTGPRIRVEL